MPDHMNCAIPALKTLRHADIAAARHGSPRGILALAERAARRPIL